MTQETDDDVAVELMGSAGVDLVEALSAANAVERADAAILLADARGKRVVPAFADALARTERKALLIVVAAPADVPVAYAAGATHVAVGAEAVADAIAFAARYVRRLRGEAPARRHDDPRTHAADDLLRSAGAQEASVVAVALGGMEIVNAAFGRDVGDAVVMAMEERVGAALATVRHAVAREGSGFSVALLGSSSDREGAAAAIGDAVAAPVTVGEETIHPGARLGVATGSARDAQALIRRAAAAASTRDRPGRRAGSSARGDRLAGDLHGAIGSGQIDVLFQPQVGMASGRIMGVEALARWRHPEYGTLGAEELFAAAEAAHLGHALSDHIQTQALSRAAGWPAALAGLRVAVNVTGDDIARGDFAGRFLDHVAKSGIARARVTVEITETRLIANLDAAAGLLGKVRGAGCRVAIDDFGTGYSSLAYLKALPLDYLKIDRSLMQDIAGDERDRVVVRGVLAMAASLGLETIAEGVETSAQRALLAAERCTYYQGFLCSQPVDSAGLIALVEEDRRC